MREYVSVVQSHPVCGHVLRQPQDTDTGTVWASEVRGPRGGRGKESTQWRRPGQSKMRGQNGEMGRWPQDAAPPALGCPAKSRWPRAEVALRPPWRRHHFPVHTHLNGVPPRVLSGQHLVSLIVQLIDPLLFNLQVPVDEILQWRGGGQ